MTGAGHNGKNAISADLDTGSAGPYSITIVHALPGRLRCCLSHQPMIWEAMKGAITNHDGIDSISYEEVTRSILVHHDPKTISMEEFIVRLAVVFAGERSTRSIRLLASPNREEMSTFSFIAGLLLAGAAATRILPGLAQLAKSIELASGIATAAAIVGHGYREIRDVGTFDPEVLSVLYLIYSLVKKKGFTASLIAWIASFGRHLLAPPVESLVLAVREEKRTPADRPSFDVSVRPDRGQPRLYTIMRYVQTILADALSGGSIARDRMIGRIQEMTRDHESVLEGIDKLDTSINVRID